MVGSRRDTEKLGKLLKYTGPSEREEVIQPNKESLNLRCLLSRKHIIKDVLRPSLVNGVMLLEPVQYEEIYSPFQRLLPITF